MRLAALAIAGLILASCAPITPRLSLGEPKQAEASEAAEMLKVFSEHLQTCDRSYQGSLGLGANFTFNIQCKAVEPTPLGEYGGPKEP